jgi:hypothetical protein
VTATARKAPKHPLVLGKKIHFRREQMILWIGLSVVLGSGFIAGLYWLVLQQRYPFLPGSGSLKNWWDNGMGIIKSGNWPAYRHGIRDGGEPTAWTLIGATILGKVKMDGRLLPLKSLIIAPVILFALIIAGTVGITWITHFGPLSHVSDTLSWQQILLGVILGRLLHLLWKPIGNTVRYHIIARGCTGAVPLWVRLPLMPPPWREAWAELKADPARCKVVLREHGEQHKSLRWAVPLAVFLFLVIAIIGNLAKYVIAHGGHVPGMIT